MIVKYRNFLLNMLCESIMISTKDFIDLIVSIRDNKISNDIFDIFAKNKDIKTNYNVIGLSDNNDEVTFIPDSQYQRMLTMGQDPWSKIKSKSKIGRMIRQILTDNPDASSNKYTDSQIEEFVNQFKVAWDKKMSKKRQIKIVKGEDIKFWYNEENYLESGGTLGNSCMRSPGRNKYMQIYASNPDKISLVILTENDKLIGRAILWNIDESEDNIKYYLDRIYVRFDSDYNFINDWVFENVAGNNTNIFGSFHKGYDRPLKCYIKKSDFDYYPYADTFCNLYIKLENGNIVEDGSFLSNRYNSDFFNNYVCYELQNTDGTYDLKSHYWSNYLSKFIEKKRAAYIDSIGDYVDVDDTVTCKFNGTKYLKSEVIFSKSMNDWIPVSYSFEHPKYGIVMNESIKSVIISYDESKSKLDLYQSVLKDNYEFFKFEDRVDKSTYFEYKAARGVRLYFDVKYEISNIYDNPYPLMLCFKIYKVIKSQEDKLIGLNISGWYRLRDGIFIIEEFAGAYEIKIDKNIFEYITIDHFIFRDTDDMFYINYMKTGDTKYSDFFKKLHDIKLDIDSEYSSKYKISKLLSESPEMLFNLVSDSMNKSLKDEEVINNIEFEFKYVDKNYDSSPVTPLSKQEREFIFNLYSLLHTYYIIYSSKSNTMELALNYINSKYPEKVSMFKRLEHYIYFSFFDGVYYTARDNFEIELAQYLRDNNIDFSHRKFIEVLKSLSVTEIISNLKIKI